ncbi:sugar MFS transporter [Cytophagaceae bacterium ABcell3]|nr:sugar MFS transporter [Cytophagaceae bacterium ABcell3]
MPGINTESSNRTSSLIVLSTLFFMWGFITVINLMLIDELMLAFELDLTEMLIINLAFFGTYFIISVPAGKLINNIGYKNGIISGVILAGIGCMLYYPAAEERSYPLVLLSTFVLASGITILQVGANPYVVLISRRGTEASRLTLVQAFNALGTVLASLLAIGLFYNLADYSPQAHEAMSPEEIKRSAANYVQLPYLIMGAVMFLLALLIGFSKLPKVITHEMEPLVKEPEDGPRRFVLQFPHLVLGAVAIFAYVGAEVTLGTYITRAAEDLAKYYWGGAMAGRFLGAFLLMSFSPRKLIGVFSTIAALLVLTYILSGPATDPSLWPIIAVGLFNSILFPCIFAMGIHGLGKFSEEGSSILIMSIVGGAVIPFIFFNIESTTAAFFLPILCYLYISYYGFKGSIYKNK